MNIISFILLLFAIVPLGYLYSYAIASFRTTPKIVTRSQPSNRFIITLPAHDEETVIGDTVRRLRTLDYPVDLFNIHIVADHCSDRTAMAAREAGAIVHERNEGPRTGKGAALSWLFQRVLANNDNDAVIIFDADTRVDLNFLRVMDARLARGDQVIQGQHVIRNPEAGWFPALTWAMFLVDNRFQNYGRDVLGWSAKHMGDSICFRADVLRQMGWGAGLTEDYQLRQQLLLADIRIAYEPNAIGRGEAALTWAQARAQRARWLRGTHDASQQFARQLLFEGIRQRNGALLDGAVQAHFPSFSSLTMMIMPILSLQIIINLLMRDIFSWGVIYAWGIIAVALFIYPLIGLALEKAPWKAYMAIFSGPLFVIWRTWLAMTSRFGKKEVVWVRTAHGGQK
ncbi:MAG: glycosyltransferase family 2 protein [Chloroflexi bacterium]|nr:glycosyltransferase family 2 protein [Chloroflexota bacterium]